MTQSYIGIKQIIGWEQVKDGVDGYCIKYPHGFIAWAPKETFESCYLPQGNDPTRINEGIVKDFISSFKIQTLDDKTTIVIADLVNGFRIVESSSCVDPANYDEAIGAEICIKRIENQVWNLLGFTLQWAREGLE